MICQRNCRPKNRKEKMKSKKGVASIRIEYNQGDIFWNLINDQVKQNNGFRIGG